MQIGKVVLYRLKQYLTIAAAIAAFAAVVYNASDDLRLLWQTGRERSEIMLAPKNDVDSPVLVNINTASAHKLQRLSGIGAAAASAIVEYREQNGGFKTVDEIVKVKGIGDKTLEKIREFITI